MVGEEFDEAKKWLANIPSDDLEHLLTLLNYYGTNAFGGIVQGVVLSRQLGDKLGRMDANSSDRT